MLQIGEREKCMMVKDLRSILEEAIDLLGSNYTETQWKDKADIDLARYRVAKKAYKEVSKHIERSEIYCDTEEEYEAINKLMYKLGRKLESIEEEMTT